MSKFLLGFVLGCLITYIGPVNLVVEVTNTVTKMYQVIQNQHSEIEKGE